MNLDPLRHGEFMRDVTNLERANVGKGIPDSVDEVVDAARKFIATPKTSAQASSALVYAAQKQLTSSQSKRPCANCDELGHWASSCPLSVTHQIKLPVSVQTNSLDTIVRLFRRNEYFMQVTQHGFGRVNDTIRSFIFL